MTHLSKICLSTVLAFALLASGVLAAGQNNPQHEYKETGSTLAAVDKHGHFYQVATEDRVYLLFCEKVKSIQFGSPECKVNGKPIAVGDTLHFRIEGDWAYLPPASGDMEEKLRILTEELKRVPPAETAPPASNAPANQERGVVIGSGTHIKGQHGIGWSTNPHPVMVGAVGAATPVIATAPVTAIPVTGGAPVLVMPTAPVSGGVVTGVPVTGGAPIVAIPTGPVTGMPVGGAGAPGAPVMMGGSRPAWVHVLRIQAGGKNYLLECSSKPCAVGGKEIMLGATLAFRVDKKSVYILGNGGADEKFKVLEVADVPAAEDTKPKPSE